MLGGQIRRIVFLRTILVFALVVVIQLAFATTFFSLLILVLLGFAWAVFYCLTLSLSMELIPPGKNAVFDVLVGTGAAVGSFMGPFLAQIFGFLNEFIIAGVLFLLAFLVLSIFTR